MFDRDREEPPDHPENNKRQQNAAAPGHEPSAEKSGRPAGLLAGQLKTKLNYNSSAVAVFSAPTVRREGGHLFLCLDPDKRVDGVAKAHGGQQQPHEKVR